MGEMKPVDSQKTAFYGYWEHFFLFGHMVREPLELVWGFMLLQGIWRKEGEAANCGCCLPQWLLYLIASYKCSSIQAHN